MSCCTQTSRHYRFQLDCPKAFELDQAQIIDDVKCEVCGLKQVSNNNDMVICDTHGCLRGLHKLCDSNNRKGYSLSTCLKMRDVLFFMTPCPLLMQATQNTWRETNSFASPANREMLSLLMRFGISTDA